MRIRFQKWANRQRSSLRTLLLAIRHPDTPWQAKVVGSLTLLYALSPVDLIPDFIPLVGHLDDLVIVPLGLWLSGSLVPRGVWLQCQQEAAHRAASAARKDSAASCSSLPGG